MAAIANDWLVPMSGEFKKPYYRKLYETVKSEYETKEVYPAPDDIFNAFAFTPLSNVKVVILGQDPYHEPGQAHGLSFSVKPSVEIPPSLVNIYKELHEDCGCYIPNNGYLKKWADQGVMLLNSVLTVRAHAANSHKNIGWEEFTDAGDPRLKRAGPPDGIHPLGTPGADEKANADESEASDPRVTAPEPTVRLPRIFRQQTVQQDKQVFKREWNRAD